MKIVATVAEYNPLHTGHIYQMQTARSELQPDAYAVVMSGNFCQRGDAAIIEKHKRAVAAVKAGADIVLELPCFYAVNCAEKFAAGAMKTLSCFGTPLTVSFGSECGDIARLAKLSERIHNETEADKTKIKAEIDAGEQLVRARAKTLDEDGDFTPNNILALEYIHYAEKYGFDCHTVARKGDFNGSDLCGEFASAGAIRENIFNGYFDKISRFLPDFTHDMFDNCISNDALLDMVLYKLNFMTTSEIKELAEVIEGLENRISSAVKISTDFSELCDCIKSKRYTMARIKRILLYALFDFTKKTAYALYHTEPYARVLAVKNERTDLLAQLAENSNLIVRGKDVRNAPVDVQNAIEYETKADAVYAIISKRRTDFNAVFVD